MKFLLLAILIAGICGWPNVSRAQSNLSPSSGILSGPTGVISPLTIKANLNSSLAAFKAGNGQQAERTLASNILSAVGTATYESQIGTQLGTVALMLKDARSASPAKQAAGQAIAHLDISKPPLSTGSATNKAQACELMALIQERIFGNLTAAQQYYQAAMQLDPQRGTSVAGFARTSYQLQLFNLHK